jgi:hypothetical protein
MKTTTVPLKHSMNRVPCPLALLLLPFALACFALSPQARAVCQEGCLTNQNTVLGDDALVNNAGLSNTAIGGAALQNNTTGDNNTAIGFAALVDNSTGDGNTGDGVSALQQNTTGSGNTAIGGYSLFSNTTGGGNTANGDAALLNNTTGNDNTATGVSGLQSNTTGANNTANGFQALWFNSTGNSNTALGNNALFNNTIGSFNIAVGNAAGGNLTTGINNIDIGNNGVAGESRTIRVGTKPIHRNTYIAGISGATVPTGIAVIVDSSGHLGTTTSSARFKESIKPMDNASEAILSFKPVTFRYKKELDPAGIRQFGLVAEEVEKVNPDLVARDEQGKPYTVRYEAVNAMLLNEFLKEHRKNEQQEVTIARQQQQIEALTEGLQKVSAQLATGRVRPSGGLESSKPAPQIVRNNQ